MCSKNEFNSLIQSITEQTKIIFKEKLHAVILYGSYARGDYDDESDIDIFVILDMPSSEINNFRTEIDSLCGELLYDYGVVVSITQRDKETFYRYIDTLPFYKNIQREGIKIA